MRKHKLVILLLGFFLFGAAASSSAAIIGLFGEPNKTDFGTIERAIGTYVDEFKGYLSPTEEWSGYYIGTFSGNNNETILTQLASAYLGMAFTPDAFAKVDEPGTTSGFLTVGYDPGNLTGTWTLANPYELGFYSVKGANEYAFYYVKPYQQSGNWSTAHLQVPGPSGNIPTISHLSALAETKAVPEPSTLLLLGLGLIGVAGVGRRKLLK